MAKNVGSADKVIRLVAGAILIALPFAFSLAAFESTAATGAAVAVGAILIGTALLNFCPLYRVLGIRTCRVG